MAKRITEPGPDDEFEIIFRKTIRLKSGRVIHAHQFGLNAFPIRVRKSRQD